MSADPADNTRRAVAVIVARDGRLPDGADEAVDEAGGHAIVVGSGTLEAAGQLAGTRHVQWSETGRGFQPAALAAALVPLVQTVPLVIMPASPDGRDLAPRVAAMLERPLVARALSAEHNPSAEDDGAGSVHTLALRLDDRVLVPVDVDGPVVVTLASNGHLSTRRQAPATLEPIELLSASEDSQPEGARHEYQDPEVVAVLEPDLATMDLGDATRVVAGGAGLVAGADDHRAIEVFDLLARVAAALGGSAGATRVATDAGWTGYERQIGTTGVAIEPELYIAFGVSGAAQHIGGLGDPKHIVSVNTDSSSPMTAMADLGLVTDAQGLLVELARRFDVEETGVPSG